MSKLVLSGGSTEKDLPLKKSEVNYLRLLLAWMRCEYMLDDDMQSGMADTVKWLVDNGHTPEEKGRELLARQADKIRHVPLYVRQGVKMLTKMIREHEKRADIVDGEVIGNRVGIEKLQLPSNVQIEGRAAFGASRSNAMLASTRLLLVGIPRKLDIDTPLSQTLK